MRKYADTFYHLEPNVKETPGGLRDYQLVCWLDQTRAKAPPNPPPELREAFRFLARLRCYLHCLSDRDNNLALLRRAGLAGRALAAWTMPRSGCASTTGTRAPSTAPRSARWKRAKRSPARCSPSCATGVRASPTPTSACTGSASTSRSPQRSGVEPELVLRLFEFVARHGIRLSQEAEQRIDARLPRLRDHFADAAAAVAGAAARFLALPHAPLAVRAMHETGVLTAIFPELEQIECLVIRDFYHRYTVDEHTLVTMQNLWSLRTANDALVPQFPGPAGRGQGTRRPRLRAAVPRLRQGHARRRPRGRFARAWRRSRWRASRCPGRIARWCCS